MQSRPLLMEKNGIKIDPQQRFQNSRFGFHSEKHNHYFRSILFLYHEDHQCSQNISSLNTLPLLVSFPISSSSANVHGHSS